MTTEPSDVTLPCPADTRDADNAGAMPTCARSTVVEKHGIENPEFLSLSQIIEDIQPVRVKGPVAGLVSGVSIDTRKPLSEDHIFWAIKGEHFNGNDFAEDALAAGVRAVVTSRADLFETPMPENATLIQVADTLNALQDARRIVSGSVQLSCGRDHRQQRQDPGKRDACVDIVSGTKDLQVAAVL